MLYLYSGTPGSGKSLHVASVIMARLRRALPVVCNFPLDISYIQGKRKRIGMYRYIPNNRLTVQELVQISKDYFQNHRYKEGAITLVIDEAQILYNARSWAKSGRDEWTSFYSQHRKYGYDIILIAQFDRMIDRQIRSLIEYEYIHRKVSNFGIWGKIYSIFCGGHLHIAVKMWYPLQERIGAEMFIARRGLYRVYDTNFDFTLKDDKKKIKEKEHGV